VQQPAYDLWVGIDWATEAHQVAVVDPAGRVVAERKVQHSGLAIAEFIDWLVGLAQGRAEVIAVAIEVPRGALVEMLGDRGIAVFYINPKQLDRFRDRHTVAGAKDDSRDAYVLGDSLRSDLHLFRPVRSDDPLTIQLRELSRLDDDLQEERLRLANRLRDQLYRFFPQVLQLCRAADEAWFWHLVELVPTPAHARTVRPARIAQLLKKHRIRRLSAEEVVAVLRTPPVKVAPGTLDAARAHIRFLLPRLHLVHQQHQDNEKQMKKILEQLASGDEPQGQKHEHRDAAIILSIPGIGSKIAATMLGEAAQALAERDYEALRTYSGQAPVTMRSGKRILVVRRRACNPQLANALYHAARCYAQNDPAARAMYQEHRQHGQPHARSLRSVAERLLRVLVAMLREGTLYDHSRKTSPPAAGATRMAAGVPTVQESAAA
jgi:transposase